MKFLLNETSYFGANSRENLVPEIKNRRFKKVLLVSDKALCEAGVTAKVEDTLRNANIALDAPGRNGYIVKGKVIPFKDNINPYFKSVTSSGLSINYGDELATQFKMSTSSDVSLNLTADCYGGICKLNEFYISTFASAGTLTINVGDYFTYQLVAPESGRKYYRFSYSTIIHGAEKSWFVEELSLS